jgi:hypothetical protein
LPSALLDIGARALEAAAQAKDGQRARPYGWAQSSYQVVLEFSGINKDGTEIRGWALCGEEFGGVLFSDEVDIKFF